MNKEQKILMDHWWEKLQPLVRKFSRETILNGMDQNDLQQECFLIFYKAVENYQEELGISFAYYYKRMLYGWRANENRKNKNKIVTGEEEMLLFLKDERVDIEKDVERSMLIEKMRGAFQKLDQQEVQIIVGYYYQNKKIKEIAQELGSSYKKIEHKKAAVLHKLKKQLEKEI